MNTFISVNDTVLEQRIKAVRSRLIIVTPAVSSKVAKAIQQRLESHDSLSITLVIDCDEEVYRTGYGYREGLEILQQVVDKHKLNLRQQSGLRIGVLLADEEVLLWSPTPRAVESQRNEQEPNGLFFENVSTSSDDRMSSLSTILSTAIGSNDNFSESTQVDVGKVPVSPSKIYSTVQKLKENPPEPFDLSRKTQVLSTKFQFVEHRLRGTKLTDREMKLSNVILDPDVPEDIRGLLLTRVKPYSDLGQVRIDVPLFVQGQIAFNSAGLPINVPMTQDELNKAWKGLLDHYLIHLRGFGWLIRRRDKDQFMASVQSFEKILREWFYGFRKEVLMHETSIVDSIVKLICPLHLVPVAKLDYCKA